MSEILDASNSSQSVTLCGTRQSYLLFTTQDLPSCHEQDNDRLISLALERIPMDWTLMQQNGDLWTLLHYLIVNWTNN